MILGDHNTSPLREFRISPWRTAREARHRGRVTVGRGFHVHGSRNITLDPGARLSLGTAHYGFVDTRAGGVLRVHGSLHIAGAVSVASGNGWEIGPEARMTVGSNTYFSPCGTVVCLEGLTIGDDCAISWGVHFLDDDLHPIWYDGSERPTSTSAPISLGNHVLVAARASILEGVSIADGCVVASGSVVTRSVDEPRCLIAGSPARVVRRGINWS